MGVSGIGLALGSTSGGVLIPVKAPRALLYTYNLFRFSVCFSNLSTKIKKTKRKSQSKECIMPPPTNCRASGNEKEICHVSGQSLWKEGIGRNKSGWHQTQSGAAYLPHASWRTRVCQIGRCVRTYTPYSRAGILGCCRLVGRHSTCCAGREWSPRMVTNKWWQKHATYMPTELGLG